jgi:hypothetical protein
MCPLSSQTMNQPCTYIHTHTHTQVHTLTGTWDMKMEAQEGTAGRWSSMQVCSFWIRDSSWRWRVLHGLEVSQSPTLCKSGDCSPHSSWELSSLVRTSEKPPVESTTRKADSGHPQTGVLRKGPVLRMRRSIRGPARHQPALEEIFQDWSLPPLLRATHPPGAHSGQFPSEGLRCTAEDSSIWKREQNPQWLIELFKTKLPYPTCLSGASHLGLTMTMWEDPRDAACFLGGCLCWWARSLGRTRTFKYGADNKCNHSIPEQSMGRKKLHLGQRLCVLCIGLSLTEGGREGGREGRREVSGKS